MPDALDPVIERIAQDLLDTLEGITTAAGYRYTLIAERAKPNLGNRRRDGLAVLVQGDAKRINEDDDSPTGRGPAYDHDEWWAAFAVVLTAMETEASTDPIDKRMNVMRSDVEKALAVDPTRGGLAILTEMGDPMPVDAPPNVNGVEWAIPLTVYYRTLAGDPYTQ
jgi:hypothetical protein